ncbi:MAG TPA: twin-arginine translocase subunit TatC, partial [Patescibacteria group bacterium]|nr:twin-arginine translocase subunit TatC [Patescibacteria group bacterium]
MIKFKKQISSKKQIKPEHNSIQQTFLEHLAELRSRLLVVVAVLVGGCVVGYIFHDMIASFLLSPLKGEKLIYLTPTGGLDFIFKISFDVGVLIAIPVAIYQLYQYLSPLIKVHQRTRRFAIFVVLLSCLLAIIGVSFGYFVILPSAIAFLANLAGKFLQPNLTATSYLDFVLLHSIGMAIIFQLPIFLLFINMINGPLKPASLFRFEKYMVLGAIVVAALIAPPDFTSQAIVAVPVFAMYQLGIIMVVIQNRMRTQPALQASQKAPLVTAPIISTTPSITKHIPRPHNPTPKP